MKKLLMSLLVIAICAGTASAQDGERRGQGGGQGGAQMREMMKEKMKTDLKLTTAQVDTVMAIQQEFQAKNRDVRNNTALSDDDKKAKTKELNEDRKKKLKTVLSEEQATKLEEFYDNMRKMREQRQGQGQ